MSKQSKFTLPRFPDYTINPPELNITFMHGDETFLAWIKPWATSFGSFAWGITVMADGNGVGGFKDSFNECAEALEEFVNDAPESLGEPIQ